MNTVDGKLAYIVGESFAELSQLPRVLTTTQFVKSVIEGNLLSDAIWMMGQGMNDVEKKLVELCKKYCSEIDFYQYQTDNERPSPEKLLAEKILSENILSKLSRWMTNFFHLRKSLMNRGLLSQ